MLNYSSIHKLLLLFFILCFSCASKGTEPSCVDDYDDMPQEILAFRADSASVFIVDSIIDLKGFCYRLPADITLKFKGGRLINGYIIGNNTKVLGTEKLFDQVVIAGSWDVERISSKMFCNMRDTNALKNLFALANAEIDNEIYIQKGNYIVKATTKHPRVLNVPSNTKVIVDGTISMVGNDFKNYSILNVSKAVNVSISGKGALVGERDTHTGEGGEWGMCISTYDSDSVSISGLNLSKGWGDGIYVGRGTKKITISDCRIDHCRRQGISVIEGTDVLIKDCIISNVEGTAPEYAIDVEPNAKDTASNVVIRNVVSKNCRGGFLVCTGKNNGSYIKNIIVENCNVSSCSKPAFAVSGANDVVLRNNTVNDCKAKFAFSVARSNNVTISDNTVTTDKYVFNDLKNVKVKGNKVKKGVVAPEGKK